MSAPQNEFAKEASGKALATVKKHSEKQDLRLFASRFCPFVQRVWIALEIKGIPYQYVEVDPYAKPKELLDVSPAGLVPAIRHGPTWSLHESAVILEYLEELSPGLLPPPDQKQARADARLWADQANRDVGPAFHRAAQAKEPEEQVKLLSELAEKLERIIKAADPEGPFFSGKEFGWVDVYFAPWIVRLQSVLAYYRGWPEPKDGSRWKKWVDAVQAHPAVQETLSDDQEYIDIFRRYAEKPADVSHLADAINKARALP